MPDEKVSNSSTTDRGGGNGFLYFAIGALIVAVGVLGWMFYDGGWRTSADNAIERSADALGDAADDIGDAARDAARSIPTPTPPQPQPAPSPAPTTPPATPPG
jgi:hypothetical protein